MPFNAVPGSPPHQPSRTALAPILAIVAVVAIALALGAYVVTQTGKSHKTANGTPVAVFTPPARTPAKTNAAIAGYYPPTGKHGRLLTVGRPWGRSCQPVRLTVEEHVPNSVYAQVVGVVTQARRDGLDITMEGRTFRWQPTSLYYPTGTNAADVERVGVFTDDTAPPILASGQPERLALGWDTALQPGGLGTLKMAVLASSPTAQRTAIRQLIALTQGIVATTSQGSGITTGTTLDAFSSADVVAMKAMSGCDNTAKSTVAHASMGPL